MEGELTLPTNGMKQSRFFIMGDPNYDLFIENIEIIQSLKKGDRVYYYLNTEDVTKDETSFTFTDLSAYNYDWYAYCVISTRGEGESMISSVESNRMIVDVANGSFMTNITGIDGMDSPAEVVEVARYTLDGRQISEPRKGLNIVRYSDGTVRKEMVK